MLSAQALSCHRGARLLLGDVSLRVAAGQALWLTGPNGVGKSTLLRVLAGLQRPLSGSVQVDAPFHYLGSESGFDATLSLADNLRWFAGLHAVPTAKITTVAAQLGIEAALPLPFHSLSQGQQQRASLARLLLAPRSLWLLDEPLAHLDVTGKQLVVSLMQSHLQQGGALIAATHEVPDIAGGQVMRLEAAT